MAKVENVSKLEREIGLRIGKLRDAAGISQQKFAEEMGVSRPVIQHWESGTRHIKADNLISIAKFFNVSSDFLLGLTEFETPHAEQRAISEYTGLNDEALKNWRECIYPGCYNGKRDNELEYLPIDFLNDLFSDHFIQWTDPSILRFCEGITGIACWPAFLGDEREKDRRETASRFNSEHLAEGLVAVDARSYALTAATDGESALSSTIGLIRHFYIQEDYKRRHGKYFDED